MDMLAGMLRAQRDLQRVMPVWKDKDVCNLGPTAKMKFISDNALALIRELCEAMDETGCKPWQSSDHINAEAYLKELIDAWHFFMNLMLIAQGELGMDEEEFAHLFYVRYHEKNDINRQRQKNGYDGLQGKCLYCKRELPEAPLVKGFCSIVCAHTFAEKYPNAAGVR